MRITVLCGGLGGARLALALQKAGLESNTTFVTNVGDDWEINGLLICPDTDAVLYALAGLFDEERGWGVRGDRFDPFDAGPDWFHIGARDLAHHRRRTDLLRSGRSLTEVTGLLAAELGIRARVLPVTDMPVRTWIRTSNGALAWQEWLVREGAEPQVEGVIYRGIEEAVAGEAVLSAILDADLLVFAASSPVASIGPILACGEVRPAIQKRTGPTVAISPVAHCRPLVLDRDLRRARARAALLRSAGVEHHPVAVARGYAGCIDAYVLDEADAEDAAAVQALGLQVRVAPTVDLSESPRLVDALLDLLETRPEWVAG